VWLRQSPVSPPLGVASAVLTIHSPPGAPSKGEKRIGHSPSASCSMPENPAMFASIVIIAPTKLRYTRTPMAVALLVQLRRDTHSAHSRWRGSTVLDVRGKDQAGGTSTATTT
jgi:hypothetical protein